jgi:hypothetical protein
MLCEEGIHIVSSVQFIGQISRYCTVGIGVLLALQFYLTSILSDTSILLFYCCLRVSLTYFRTFFKIFSSFIIILSIVFLLIFAVLMVSAVSSPFLHLCDFFCPSLLYVSLPFSIRTLIMFLLRILTLPLFSLQSLLTRIPTFKLFSLSQFLSGDTIFSFTYFPLHCTTFHSDDTLYLCLCRFIFILIYFSDSFIFWFYLYLLRPTCLFFCRICFSLSFLSVCGINGFLFLSHLCILHEEGKSVDRSWIACRPFCMVQIREYSTIGVTEHFKNSRFIE